MNGKDDGVMVQTNQEKRQARLAILARAGAKQMLALWKPLGLDPCCEMVRGPETGLLALRGRMGGGGAPFNFGEATVTRATVRLEDGTLGHSVMLGRNAAKAQLAAVIDALAEQPEFSNLVEEKIVLPLQEQLSQQDDVAQAEAEATKVSFFTMVRGDD
ncbi:phosphonate C-P lyase system protein PhnG [Cohaesibacter gelatinilyticus]